MENIQQPAPAAPILNVGDILWTRRRHGKELYKHVVTRVTPKRAYLCYYPTAPGKHPQEVEVKREGETYYGEAASFVWNERNGDTWRCRQFFADSDEYRAAAAAQEFITQAKSDLTRIESIKIPDAQAEIWAEKVRHLRDWAESAQSTDKQQTT